MQFALGHETLTLLQIHPPTTLGQTPPHLFAQPLLNLERSLKMGDRNHGHMVSGHAEGLGQVLKKEWMGESLILTVQLPTGAFSNILVKGSATLNGVSLTVNRVASPALSVCLIPETLKRTNLGTLTVGDVVSFETDWMSKLIRSQLAGFQVSSLFAVNP
jgi:riboflavin synthase